MLLEIKVPVLPESVTEGTLGAWHKKVGDAVKESEHIVDLETDKVVLEIVATSAGVLTSIDIEEGATVTNNQILGKIDTAAAVAEPKQEAAETAVSESRAGPAARKMLKQNELTKDEVDGTGPKGAVTKQDVERHLSASASVSPAQSAPATPSSEPVASGQRNDRRVPMSRMRSRIAERLKEAQNSAAMLTTFNEVDLKPMMDLRTRYKDTFEKTHGVKLGMMSFFTKAAVEALKRFPAVNASIDGKDIVYHDYFDVGIAVSSERGLVVPILRDVDDMSYADIELAIRGMSEKARDGKLGIDDLTGGTFSITNGGVFGSMLSTPILNPPQSAILGMHNIQQRAVVVDGEIVIRPMMYLALTYDHRIIDGREAVQFLVTIKSILEDPARLLLQI
ncbi:MAG: 2-oxoglutarate dehydrogenase complex dihydrolipoyllysine-residue succinyltransferase [Gammaproteobacteria bacterium]|nr:2-oxoglutarate dehydrogenase complex dihydrolipoyllysine-residue succinyltransferase [Gammaproteobacteria bacterium]